MTISKSISKKIIDHLTHISVASAVKRVVVDEKYAAVLLANGGIGVAAGYDKSDFIKFTELPETESFPDKKAHKLIAKFGSSDKINRAVA